MQGPPETSSQSHDGGLPPRLLSKLRLEIPGYEILDLIASGGQATVYRGRELTSQMTVAIKVLHGGPYADETTRQRFRRETAALKTLNHPNIVFPIEFGTTPAGHDYLVMNYLDGRPLDALWADPAFAAKVAPQPPAKLRLFRQICAIVQAAHRNGITHRDLSPSNILIDNASGQPHILDFGMASTAFDEMLSPEGRAITVTGQFIGKIKYAAPEQALCNRESVDTRTDVYSLGVLLYQLITGGAFPYAVVGNVVDVLNNVINAPPVSLSVSHQPTSGANDPPLVNETIEAIVLKALEKDPNRRYENAGAMGADIESYLDGRPTTAQPIIKRGQPKRRRPIFVLTTVTLILITGVLMNSRSMRSR